MNDSNDWYYNGEPVETAIENVGLHTYNVVMKFLDSNLKTDLDDNKIFVGRISFFRCCLSECPASGMRINECYANLIPRFELLCTHANPEVYNWPDKPREIEYHHSAGLFSLMLSGNRHFRFNSAPNTNEYNDEVRSVFKDVFKASNKDLPIVDKWDESKKMTHIFGCTHIQTSKNKRMIFSIESMTPPVKADVSQNLDNKWNIIMSECEKANEDISCEACLQGKNDERLGCQRLYPRIREIFANFSSQCDVLSQDQLTFDSDVACPLSL